MTTGQTPAQTLLTRVWLTEGGARPDHKPDFQSCMRAGPGEQDFGTPEQILCPDPTTYGKTTVTGEIIPVPESPTTELTGRYALDMASAMLRLAKQGCPSDIQVHMGDCENPMDFNDGFKKALIFETARFTSWSTTDLGSLEEGAVIDETAPVTGRKMYEVLPLSLGGKAEDVILYEVLDVVICDRIGCGECDNESDGCQIVYALTDSPTGSPGAPADVAYSTDGGETFALNDIDTLAEGQKPSALACIGKYVVVVSNDTGSLHYKTKANINAGTVGGWTEVTTGFETGGEPNDIWSVGTMAFIVGDGGYIYTVDDPSLGVTVIDASEATTQNLMAVHAISEERAVAVGVDDSVVFTTNKITWQTGDATGGGVTNQAVWMHDKDTWSVGDNGGSLYYTLDQADNWVLKGLPGAPSQIFDIAFSSKSVGYIGGINTAGTGAWMARTYNGGYSWRAMPEGPGSLPGTTSGVPGFIEAIAACIEDENMAVFVGGVGTYGAAVDGIIIVGKD